MDWKHLHALKATQRRTGIPFLYVTHNVAEVIKIGDYVIVLNEGRVIRQGSAQEITLVQNE